MKISIILSTYNRPKALLAVLEAIELQTVKGFEVCIADDGSTSETAQVIEHFQQQATFPIHHAWQADNGFRAASARNKAVKLSVGDYLLFLDGDCIPRPDWIQQHISLAETGSFVAGNRVLLDPEITHEIEERKLRCCDLFGIKLFQHRRHINRLLPLMRLPLGGLRAIKATSWEKVRTCNLGVWRKNFIEVNGFDEAYEGWGFEDSDLAIRLLNSGIHRKLGIFATTVLHLYHREYDRQLTGINRERLEQRIRSKVTLPEKGLI